MHPFGLYSGHPNKGLGSRKINALRMMAMSTFTRPSAVIWKRTCFASNLKAYIPNFRKKTMKGACLRQTFQGRESIQENPASDAHLRDKSGQKPAFW
jgi:hypothetical protein